MRLPARAVACSSSINSRRLRAKSTSRVDSSGKKKRKEKEAKERERKREKERLYKVGAGTGGSSVVDRHVTNFHLRFSFRQLPSKKSKQTICFVFFCNRISTLKIKRIKFPAIPIDIPISKPPKNPSSSGRVAFYLLNSVHKFSDLISIRKKKKIEFSTVLPV
jgi:hypothetical protein